MLAASSGARGQFPEDAVDILDLLGELRKLDDAFAWHGAYPRSSPLGVTRFTEGSPYIRDFNFSSCKIALRIGVINDRCENCERFVGWTVKPWLGVPEISACPLG